jgi:uncharacterized membrane protein
VGGVWSGVDDGKYAAASQVVTNGVATPLSFMPYAINDAGQVVGTNAHPVTYKNGQFVDFYSGSDRLHTDARAIAINQSGEMIVNATDTSHALQSYLYKPSGPALQNYYAFDLPKLPDGSRMIATALNNNGQIVGGGYLDDNGVVKSLASLLPASSGWSDLVSTAINDAGQIVGQGLIHGQERAFLLTPDASNVPEPATVLLWSLVTMASLCRIGVAKRGRQ